MQRASLKNKTGDVSCIDDLFISLVHVPLPMDWGAVVIVWYNQCLSPLKLWVPTPLMAREVYAIQHYVINFVSDLLQVGWFSSGTPVSSTNKTSRHDITEILLKVALNIMTPFYGLTDNEIYMWTWFHDFNIFSNLVTILWCTEFHGGIVFLFILTQKL